jgi:hypothetical protein
MSIQYFGDVSITTESAHQSSDLPRDPHWSPVPGTLEQSQNWLRPGFYSSGGFKMLEIVIVKSRGGRDLKSQFSNTYLFSGSPDYISDDARTVVDNLVNAESSIYFDDTFFMRAIIRNLDAQGRHTDGETRSIPMEGGGLNAMPAASTNVPANVVVAISKLVLVGRAGLQEYRYALTSDEYNAFVEQGTAPPRIVEPQAPGDLGNLTFVDRLANVGLGTGLDMILPPNSRYAGGAPRPITAFAWAGIRYRQSTIQRVGGAQHLAEAVQQLLNETARKLRKLLRDATGANGNVLVQLVGLARALIAAATAKYATLTALEAAEVTWPAIYSSVELLALLA